MKTKKQLEAKLTLQQRKAALMLVESELADEETRKTQDEISELCDTTRMTLYRWRTQNRDFIDYMNLLADDFLSAHRSEVYKHLMSAVRTGANGRPSIKAIDTFFKRFALLTEKVVETSESTGGSNEDIEKDIAELERELDDLETNE
jgi:Helix-turn-helix of insertion element transposase